MRRGAGLPATPATKPGIEAPAQPPFSGGEGQTPGLFPGLCDQLVPQISGHINVIHSREGPQVPRLLDGKKEPWVLGSRADRQQGVGGRPVLGCELSRACSPCCCSAALSCLPDPGFWITAWHGPTAPKAQPSRAARLPQPFSASSFSLCLVFLSSVLNAEYCLTWY